MSLRLHLTVWFPDPVVVGPDELPVPFVVTHPDMLRPGPAWGGDCWECLFPHGHLCYFCGVKLSHEQCQDGPKLHVCYEYALGLMAADEAGELDGRGDDDH